MTADACLAKNIWWSGNLLYVLPVENVPILAECNLEHWQE
jgi:hypothetical protein